MEKDGYGGEMLDLPVHNEIHGSKSTKSPQIQQIQEIFGMSIFVGIFEIRSNQNKNWLENGGEDSKM